jgi:hypothetical protein
MSEISFKIRTDDYHDEDDLKEVEFMISIMIDFVNRKKIQFKKRDEATQLKTKIRNKKSKLQTILEKEISECPVHN